MVAKISANKWNAVGAGQIPPLAGGETAKGLARPGWQAVKGSTASSVSEANGKLARPGGAQNDKGRTSEKGSVARPGGPQGISGRGVNTKSRNMMAATTDG